MKRLIAILLCGVLCAGFFSGCTQNQTQQPEKQPENPSQTQTDSNNEQHTDDDLETLKEQIIITCEYDKEVQEGGKQRVIVKAENTTDKTFTGDVHVTFKAGTKIVGRDMMIIEDLTPGNTTWCNMYTEICIEDPVAEISFSKGYKFEEDGLGGESSGARIDEAMSAALKEYFDGNFFSTSWYPEIKKCEVFSQDGKYYAEITVGSPNDQQINTIGRTAVMSFKEVALEKVVVKNESGDILKTISQR